MIGPKVFIAPLQRMATTIPSSCRVPHFVGDKKINFEEKAVPEPGPGQLLLRVRANALCGSERPQFFDGASVTPGHEATGTVVAAGPGTRTPVGTTGAVFLGHHLKILITDVVPYRLELAERLGGLPVNVANTTLN